ncbi:MAG TPA: spermidine/putrescine ABC transporter ATP-binding protein [Firmicutes bacterium]|nr:spermidine/putrescine ABC transporter ATP-binding protein [Bacillota bacterium]
MKPPLLNLININKYFGDVHVLKDISFTIEQGEFLTLLGPSGCGKTTLLRCIAGLESVHSGDILLNGSSIKGTAPNKRNVNTVFQNYALFPHLNVYDNIAYGPRVKKSMKEAELKERVRDVLDLVQMLGFEQRMPHQLSGGQRQRIAIARALINEPAILLLDEPLGALDLKLRKHMQTELAHLQKKTGTTFVYVTHDQEEALNMSDRIVVIDQGTVQQLGSPRDIYNNPVNLFVTTFIGDRNIMQVEVLETKGTHSKVKLGDNVVSIRNPKQHRLESGQVATLAIHMDKMRVLCDETPNALKGEVSSIHYAGSQIRMELKVDDKMITVVEYQKTDCECEIGDSVYIVWEDHGAILLPLDYSGVEREV